MTGEARTWPSSGLDVGQLTVMPYTAFAWAWVMEAMGCLYYSGPGFVVGSVGVGTPF